MPRQSCWPQQRRSALALELLPFRAPLSSEWIVFCLYLLAFSISVSTSISFNTIIINIIAITITITIIITVIIIVIITIISCKQY